MAVNPHPGNDYYVSPAGTVQRQSNPLLAAGLLATGWQGPVDWPTAQAALQFLQGQPNVSQLNTGVKAGQAAVKAAGSVASWTDGLSKLLSDLGSRSMWIRIAEVVIGVGLVIVAVAELAKGTPVGDAAKSAGKAAFIL